MEHYVELGGRKLLVRPANLKTIKRWLTVQKEVRVGTVEYLDEVGAFIHAALSRGNPDLDREWLEEQLDEQNIAPTIAKIYEAGRILSGEGERPQNP